ncbi:hypothetical protein CYLTODRAFT_447483 [Cylindrobasidium torrendii FP15055 ss-10]|uniref:DUF6534 domain-containing protein n=1 Tax=Cylindrobasidium torrendii FP15055 ss-10 TaxID=1314674 RepID=A0A0D7AU63_9AGAR|nr:hypothetical protein CYLTODRAFT_447483 [Cylindrobasidium torrendii FP15055 ss-10]
MTVGFSIHSTLGALFVSCCVGNALYGAGCIQAWYYYQKHSRGDYLAIKLLVAFVLICDTVQQALICEAVYTYAVTLHDDPLAMTKMVNTVMIELFFGGALAFVIQQFYCWRIWQLSRNVVVSGFVSLISLASLALIYAYTGLTVSYDSLGELIQQRTFANVLNAFNAVTDILITVAMIYYLQSAKTAFRGTRDMLNRLTIFTFNTGIPTSLFAILDLITLNTMPDTFIYMSFYLVMDRLYTNSILVTLNSRSSIRRTGAQAGGLNVDTGVSGGSSSDNTMRPHVPTESFGLAQFRSQGHNKYEKPDTIAIQIDSKTDVFPPDKSLHGPDEF